MELDDLFPETPAPKQLDEFKPFEHFMTVGDLRQRIKDLPDDVFQFFPSDAPQKFFQPWSASINNNLLLIHAHY